MSKAIHTIRWIFLLALVAFACSSVGYAKVTADIEAFVRNGCPHCAKAESFLHKLQQEQPTLKIVIRDVSKDTAALGDLQKLAKGQDIRVVRVPAFQISGQLLIGYTDETSSGQLIRDVLAQTSTIAKPPDSAGCEADEQALSCEANPAPKTAPPQMFAVNFLGHKLTLEDVGLPLFTVAMGLLDGFNPCSLWVLLLMIALLAPMNNRPRMLAIAGTFVIVEGIAYFVFMAAWLNLFLLIGLSRISEIIIALIALIAGMINLKDFWRFGWGVSLSIPDAAKPAIYERIRNILQAKNMTAAIIGAVILAVLVQIVEFMCTSGFPALYTRILTLKQLDTISYYGYLLLYNLAYMFDDLIILSIGVITLSQHRLQEKEGRWLKLISGLTMVGLGIYLLIA
jgi:glutaredoxin